MPDAPEVIANFLETEQDMSCKRNAFLMLLHADQEKALSFLASCLDQVSSFGDILQLVIVELIYKVKQRNCTNIYQFSLYFTYSLFFHRCATLIHRKGLDSFVVYIIY